MDRRRFVATLASGIAAASGAAAAQAPERVARVGFLSSARRPTDAELQRSPWSLEMQRLGWVEGRNLVVERRFADRQDELLADYARELVDARVDVIVTMGDPDAAPVRKLTSTLPIVVIYNGLDPVEDRLIASFARPGGNVTGVSALGPELAAKSIELLRELQPGLKRLGVLAHATDSFTPAMLAAVMPAAAALGLQLQVERVAGPGDYAAVFERWRRQQAEAVFVQPSLPGAPAAELALQHGLPSCSFVRGFVAQGGLLAYANDLAEIARLVVDAVDRILRGASPAQLPVQQNTRFGLLINLRTARALGVAVPPVLLARATEVLE